MGRTLNGLKINSEKTYTLGPEEVAYLQTLHMKIQSRLDALQQEIASEYLHHVAVQKFGYASNTDLRFSLDMNKEKDNFQIMNVSK